MKISDIIPGRSYVDRHGNIFRVREISGREVEYHILGIHLIPLASSRLEVFASAMVLDLSRK
jgi:hypothetical protein